MRQRCTVLIVLAVLAAASAGAQEEADPNRTAVSVVGGLSVGSSGSFGGRPFGGAFRGDGETGFAVGGGIAHDLSPRLTVEASGLFLDRGTNAWSADAGLRLNLAPSRESLVPYFAVSGGLYGQSADVRSGRDDDALRPRDLRGGAIGIGLPGGRGPRNVVRGIALDASRPDDFVSRSSSTDAMMTLGGGVRFAAGPHVFVRPDARAQVLFGGDTRVLGLFTLSFGYRF
jgi:hypothetical protein